MNLVKNSFVGNRREEKKSNERRKVGDCVARSSIKKGPWCREVEGAAAKLARSLADSLSSKMQARYWVRRVGVSESSAGIHEKRIIVGSGSGTKVTTAVVVQHRPERECEGEIAIKLHSLR